MTDKKYLDADDLVDLLGIGKAKAYEVLRTLNAELEEKGFLVIKGRAPRRYIFQRLGIEEGVN